MRNNSAAIRCLVSSDWKYWALCRSIAFRAVLMTPFQGSRTGVFHSRATEEEANYLHILGKPVLLEFFQLEIDSFRELREEF